jgi:hypothetical protein
MAETLVKNQVCGACGSDVRRHSLFCYHCGNALKSEEVSKGTEEPSDIWFREDITSTTEEKFNPQPLGKNESELDNKIIESEKNEQVSDDSESETEDVSEVSAQTDKVEEKEDSHSQTDIKKEVRKKRIRTKQVKEKNVDNSVEVIPDNKENDNNEAIESISNKVQDTKLRSAAALRKKAKPTRLRKVEIIWEERDNSANVGFIVVTFILALIVSGLIFLAFYLK